MQGAGGLEFNGYGSKVSGSVTANMAVARMTSNTQLEALGP
jgi:hypothetical protein